MSKQKYYVKLSPEVMYYSSHDGFESPVYTDVWLNKLGIFVLAGDRTSFTKSELGKIMDGAIYKGCVLPDRHEFSSDCKPWINPLIELVPVEDGE